MRGALGVINLIGVPVGTDVTCVEYVTRRKRTISIRGSFELLYAFDLYRTTPYVSSPYCCGR